MDSFATFNLGANQRRDKNSCCIFHFRDMDELVRAREAIRAQHPNAFCIPPPYQAQNPDGQFEPIGTAWYLLKTGESKNDFAEEPIFFNVS